jgi:hypothetical protein
VLLSGAVTPDQFNMRISTTLLGLGALAAVSCGAPAELDESQFPELDATGYTDGAGSNTGGLPPGNSPTGGASGTGGTGMAMVGAGGAPSVGGAAPANVPTGGAAPVAGGSSGTTGTTTPPSSGGCPDDITVLFNRPIEQGGCAGGACHVPGATRPDLVSPNPEDRLLNVQSSCNALPYVGATVEGSFLALKVTAPPNDCGLAMPFFMPQALDEEDRECILAWVDEISGG